MGAKKKLNIVVLILLQLLLDFSSRTDLMIRRMTKEHVAKFGVREFPSLFLIEREGTFKKIAE